MNIAIKAGRNVYTANFEAIRKVRVQVRDYTIGWATIDSGGFTFTFPAIITPWKNHVLTVSDWQAPWVSLAPNLADPQDVRKLIRTGQGQFHSPRTGRGSDIVKHFAYGTIASGGTSRSVTQ